MPRLFTYVKVVSWKSRNEKKENRAIEIILFFFLYRYLDQSPGYQGYLKVDFRRWNSITYFFPGYTYYPVPGVASATCLNFGISSRWNEIRVKRWSKIETIKNYPFFSLFFLPDDISGNFIERIRKAF